jgi:hypothetical protein
MLNTICEENSRYSSNTTNLTERSALQALSENQSPEHSDTPRITFKRPSSISDRTSKFRRYLEKENDEDSFTVPDDELFNIMSNAASTPLPTSSKRSLTPLIVLEKVCVSSEDIADFSLKFNQRESDESTENTAEKKKSTKQPKQERLSRRSSGRPKRNARPREGSLAEKSINVKLRRDF